LSRDLIIELAQFGFYQADFNGQKADTKYKNKLAELVYNVQKKQPLDTKVSPNNLKEILTSNDFNALQNGNYDKFEINKNPEAKKKAAEFVGTLQGFKASKQSNSKMVRVQKINFNNADKVAIVTGVTSNKPLTKDSVIKKYKSKITDEFKNIEYDRLSKVNYAKGFNWWKALGMTLAVLNNLAHGKILKDFSKALQSYADSIHELSGGHKVSNIK
jgi:hypothetical protein